jgi:hypothetical protein
MRRIITRIAGNKRALARMVVILVLLLAAVILAAFTGANPALLVGSCVGAALSLCVGSLVAILENDRLETVPSAFLDAARKDVRQASYHREGQRIRVSVLKAPSGDEVIELRFAAALIPADGIAKIRHPRIVPPSGVTLDSAVYRIDGSPIHADEDKEISSSAKDDLVIRYRIDEPKPDYVEDTHHWPCPVLDYAVEFDSSCGYALQVGKIIAGANTIALSKRRPRRARMEEFVGNGPAFTTQGVKWKLIRHAASTGAVSA